MLQALVVAGIGFLADVAFVHEDAECIIHLILPDLDGRLNLLSQFGELAGNFDDVEVEEAVLGLEVIELFQEFVKFQKGLMGGIEFREVRRNFALHPGIDCVQDRLFVFVVVFKITVAHSELLRNVAATDIRKAVCVVQFYRLVNDLVFCSHGLKFFAWPDPAEPHNSLK